MPENEVIQAAENCIANGDCENCPYNGENGCCRRLTEDLINIINRLKLYVEVPENDTE